MEGKQKCRYVCVQEQTACTLDALAGMTDFCKSDIMGSALARLSRDIEMARAGYEVVYRKKDNYRDVFAPTGYNEFLQKFLKR